MGDGAALPDVAVAIGRPEPFRFLVRKVLLGVSSVD
jgi:hypothetical protein